MPLPTAARAPTRASQSAMAGDDAKASPSGSVIATLASSTHG